MRWEGGWRPGCSLTSASSEVEDAEGRPPCAGGRDTEEVPGRTPSFKGERQAAVGRGSLRRTRHVSAPRAFRDNLHYDFFDDKRNFAHCKQILEKKAMRKAKIPSSHD